MSSKTLQQPGQFVKRILCVIGTWLSVLIASCSPAPPAPVISTPEAHGKIAFVSEQHTQVFGVSVDVTYGLYVLDFDVPSTSRFVIAPGSAKLSHPTWSPSGETLMCHRTRYDQTRGYIHRNVIVDAATGGVTDTVQLFADAWIGRNPARSPDGTMVAFTHGNMIHLYEVDTRRKIKTLQAPATILHPTWSPDSRHIAFQHAPRPAATPVPTVTRGIAILSVDDATFTQITFNDADTSPAWGPRSGDLRLTGGEAGATDGRIVFVRKGNIYIMASDGTHITPLTHDGQSFAPTWSPDGQQIAFLSSKHRQCGQPLWDNPPFCTNALYIMNADGSHIQLVRQENEHIWEPVWGNGSPLRYRSNTFPSS
jgi:Tol biopolymer transport system component